MKRKDNFSIHTSFRKTKKGGCISDGVGMFDAPSLFTVVVTIQHNLHLQLTVQHCRSTIAIKPFWSVISNMQQYNNYRRILWKCKIWIQALFKSNFKQSWNNDLPFHFYSRIFLNKNQEILFEKMCRIILHIFQEEFRSLIAYRYRAKVKFGKNSFFC